MFKCLCNYVLLMLISLNLTAVCCAKTITVSQNNDSDHKSISNALSEAENFDIIEVGPGTYNESLEIRNSITLKGFGPNFTTINSTFNIDNANQNSINISRVDITVKLQGFTIISNFDGIYIGDELINTNIIVKNCVITGCNNGIFVKVRIGNTIKIINNTITYNRMTGVNANHYVGNSPSSFLIQGNIVSHNGETGIGISKYHNKNIDFNNIYDNSLEYEGFIATINTISESSKFLEKNFVLSKDSPCINKGIIGLAYQDPDGSRNDIGAYAGAESLMFWPYPVNGPAVSNLFVNPVSVPQGQQIKIRVEGRIR